MTIESATCAACGAELRGGTVGCDVCGFVAGRAEPAAAASREPAAAAPPPPVRRPPPPPPPRDPEPTPPPPAAPRAPAASRPGAVTGVARAIRERSEQSSNSETEHIVTFRVERFDDQGQALAPVPVEMRGLQFRGVLSDGDWVEIEGGFRPGQTLTPRAVQNLTTGGAFHAKRRSRAVFMVQLLIFGLISAFIVGIAVLVFGKVLGELL